MIGLANMLRDLDRVIAGEADEMNDQVRDFLRTKLSSALSRLNNPQPKPADNIIRLHKPDPTVGTSPRRGRFQG